MQKELLTLTIVQSDIVWEDRAENLRQYSATLKKLPQTDLILFPEMFTTGFSMSTQHLAESMEGNTLYWLKEQSAQLRAAIGASLIIKEDDCFYNRFVLAAPDGSVAWYDKHHLFTMGNEHLHYTPGNTRVTMEYLGWRIRPIICYDLRFPVWSRNHDDYDLLICAANWPSPRHHVWKNMVVTRALENQCYCAAINRVGIDGMQLQFLGDSALVDPKGDVFFMGQEATHKTFTLSKPELQAFRSKFPVLNDRDDFTLQAF